MMERLAGKNGRRAGAKEETSGRSWRHLTHFLILSIGFTPLRFGPLGGFAFAAIETKTAAARFFG